MAVSSRMPLEFIAVVGVLMVTIAIVEVPRSNMRPPDLLGPDYQMRHQPAEVASPLIVPPADSEAATEPDALRLERLEAELQATIREFERARAEVVAAQRRLDRTRAGRALH